MYPLMSLVGNFAPIISGVYVTALSRYLKSFSPLSDDHVFELSLKYSSLVMTGSIAMIALLHNSLSRTAQREQLQSPLEGTAATAAPLVTNTTLSSTSSESKPLLTKRPSLSIRESFGVLSRDRYLTNIAKMVLSYGLAIEFTEILWKAVVKKGPHLTSPLPCHLLCFPHLLAAFPTQTEYMTFMTQYSALVGVGSTVMMLIGSNFVSTLGWKFGALSTPGEYLHQLALTH
jgi:ATP:ADP antiporter, AAA family